MREKRKLQQKKTWKMADAPGSASRRLIGGIGADQLSILILIFSMLSVSCLSLDLGDVSYICGEGDECPSGYSCREGCCIRDGAEMQGQDYYFHQKYGCITGCVIGDEHYQPEQINPENSCEVCKPGTDRDGWSNVEAGEICEEDGEEGLCDGEGNCETASEYVELLVIIQGTGADAVRSEPPGIDCPDECTASFGKGEIVTLMAYPDDGRLFERWDGDCNQGSENPCVIYLDMNRSITAVFKSETPAECRSHYDCNEQQGNVCHPSRNECVDGCVIGDEHYEPEQINPENQCMVCDPGNNTDEWTDVGEGVSCGEDGGMVCDGAGNCVDCVEHDDCVEEGHVCHPDDNECVEGCVIEGVYYSPGDKSENQCKVCEPGNNTEDWSDVGEGVSCGEDGENMMCDGQGDCVEWQPRLTVVIAGNGSGSVTSVPEGIDCPGDCEEFFEEGTQVTLRPHPDEGSYFEGWSECILTSAADDTCVVDLNRDVTVTADFKSYEYTLTVEISNEGTGSGKIISNNEGIEGIDCPDTCAETYIHGTVVELSAEADPGSYFAGFSGECAGSNPCSITMDGDKDITARFERDWIQTTTGKEHSCGIDTAGRLWCWGNGGDGRLGVGSSQTDNQDLPVEVATPQLGSTWIHVSAGEEHTCAVREGQNQNFGQLYCWGKGDDGRLGTGDDDDEESPELVSGNIQNWISVSAGKEHTCAVRAGGAASSQSNLFCWGEGGDGQLGTGDDEDYDEPVSVNGGYNDWLMVSAGYEHTCGIREVGTNKGSLWCWGKGSHGRLGVGDDDERYEPEEVNGNNNDWLMVSAGKEHTCGIREVGTNKGRLWCWGREKDGRLGTGSSGNENTPQEVSGEHDDWIYVTAGYEHTCGIREVGTNKGSLWCWGKGKDDQLGVGEDNNEDEPVEVSGNHTVWLDVSASYKHTCAIRLSDCEGGNDHFCFGKGDKGQLGYGGTSDKEVPERVR